MIAIVPRSLALLPEGSSTSRNKTFVWRAGMLHKVTNKTSPSPPSHISAIAFARLVIHDDIEAKEIHHPTVAPRTSLCLLTPHCSLGEAGFEGTKVGVSFTTLTWRGAVVEKSEDGETGGCRVPIWVVASLWASLG
jgi:hypothetical protein